MAYDDPDDRFDDDVMAQPRGVRTTHRRGPPQGKRLPDAPQSGARRYPVPEVDANAPGQDPTDGGISEALRQQWMAQMLWQNLNPALVPAYSNPDYVGPGVPSEMPGENADGDTELGAMFDPTPLRKQRPKR